jgi:hypothetical protein
MVVKPLVRLDYVFFFLYPCGFAGRKYDVKQNVLKLPDLGWVATHTQHEKHFFILLCC